MPSNVLAPGVPSSAPAVLDGPSGVPILRALGRRPLLDEETGLGPPPAAEHRAQVVFEVTGIVLLLLIAGAAAWILIRKRT